MWGTFECIVDSPGENNFDARLCSILSRCLSICAGMYTIIRYNVRIYFILFLQGVYAFVYYRAAAVRSSLLRYLWLSAMRGYGNSWITGGIS